jgi:hypothetical protein
MCYDHEYNVLIFIILRENFVFNVFIHFWSFFFGLSIRSRSLHSELFLRQLGQVFSEAF